MKNSREYDKLNQYIEALNSGSYYMDSPDRKAFKDYLYNTYGTDVIEGHVWISQLDDVQRENVLKRIPFVEYSFIIKNDF